ncbi:MAG: serine/threonine-protein kinase [Anaerolineales bacterium]|nr:serine/threonine-protein kinase [Anaerolineales bacterium]
MTEWVGRTLSKVQIERRIGRGGMAEVFLGRHTTLKRATVVKILYDYLSEDRRHRARFLTEAQAIAALRHPNIVQVFDFDLVDGRPYIVMELLDGITLEAHLDALNAQGARIPFERIIQLITRLSAALDYAHGEEVLHRDVKPANIMLCSASTKIIPGDPLPDDVEPVLTDFGLARLRAGSDHTIPGKHQITPAIPGQTLPGTVMGTPAYMSPEQVEGKDVSEKSDIYALGIVAYEMIAGRQPFISEDNSPGPVMYMQVHNQPPAIPNLKASVSDSLQRALAKIPGERFDTAGAFALDLKDAIRARDQAFQQSWHRLRRLSGKTWLVIAAGFFLFSTAAIIGLISLDSGQGDAPDPTQAAVAETATLRSAVESTPLAGVRSAGTISLAAPPTSSPTAWPTPDKDVRDRLDLNSPDYIDSFDESRHWYTYDTPGSAFYLIEGGALIGRDYEPEEIYTWWSWLGRPSGNLYAEVTAANGDCIEKDSVGLAIRIDEQSAKGGYGFEVSCDGFWRLRLHRTDSGPRELTGWAPSSAINRGPYAENRLGLFAFRDQFFLYINGEPVSHVIDPTYSRSFGNFALYVRSSMTYDLEARFDDFAFWHVRYVP